MYRLKAFGEFPGLSNNDPNQVNRLGELSTYAETFATDRGIFKDNSKPNSLMVSFSSLQEISAVESVLVAVPPSVSALTLEIMEKLFAKADAGELDNQEVPVREFMLTFWAGTIQNVTVNTMVTDGNRWLPSSIIFEGTSVTNPFQVQVWFSDDSFRNEYDLYINKVVPPLENLDRFFDSATAVQAILDTELTIYAIMTKASEVTNLQPSTDVITTEFEWVDPANSARRIGIPWTVVNYGEAGRNIDSIRTDLAKYILANTQYTEAEWQKLFPDIFGSTEFIFAPTFQHIALLDDAVNGGVYAPINNMKHLTAVVSSVIRGAGYTAQYIADNLNVMNSTYKSIQMGVIGGYRNRDGVNQVGDRWKDYIAVSTNSLDFKRMDAKTQQFAIVLSQMLAIAETMTVTSTVPRGFMRLIRDEILYVTATYDKTSLIVVSRTSVLEKYQVTQGVTPVPVTVG